MPATADLPAFRPAAVLAALTILLSACPNGGEDPLQVPNTPDFFYAIALGSEEIMVTWNDGEYPEEG